MVLCRRKTAYLGVQRAWIIVATTASLCNLCCPLYGTGKMPGSNLNENTLTWHMRCYSLLYGLCESMLTTEPLRVCLHQSSQLAEAQHRLVSGKVRYVTPPVKRHESLLAGGGEVDVSYKYCATTTATSQRFVEYGLSNHTARTSSHTATLFVIVGGYR